MTGTAATEAAELMNTYELGVVPIPTNMPVGRADQADLIYKGEVGQVRRRRRRHRRALRARPAGPRRHRQRREERVPVAPARPARHRPRGAQRQAAHPGGADRRPGRPPARRHRGHEHGRSRRRHPPRRQPRGLARHEVLKEGHDAEVLVDDVRPAAAARPDARGLPGGRGPRRWPATTSCSPSSRRSARPRATRSASSAACTSSAPSATSQPAHRQPAARPLGPPGRPRREPLLPQPRRRADAPVRHRRAVVRDGPGAARRRGDRGEDGHQGHRAGADHRRDSATPRSARTSSSTTR